MAVLLGPGSIWITPEVIQATAVFLWWSASGHCVVGLK